MTPATVPTRANQLRLGRAAAIAGLSRPTLAAAFDRGELRGERVGRERRVSLEELARYLVARGASPPPTQSEGPLLRRIVGSLPDGCAIGGYRAVTARHPRYRLASTSAILWTTRRRFEELVSRADPAEVARDRFGRPAAVLRVRGTEVVRIVPWPETFGRLVTRRGGGRHLTADRLLVSFALEQALRARVGDADLETLALLVLEPGLDLAGVLELLDRTAGTPERFVLPLGARTSSLVEVPLRDAGGSARDLIAGVLRRIIETPTASVPGLARRAGLRPLGRSAWRDLARRTPPALIEGDRVLSLVASV